VVVLAWVANVQFSDREHRGCFTLLGHIAAFVGQWEHKANGCLFLDISVSQNDLGLTKSLRTWRVYLALEGQWEVPSHSQGWSSFCCSSHSFWLSSKGQSWREQSCRFQEHKLKINSWKPFQPFIFDFFFSSAFEEAQLSHCCRWPVLAEQLGNASCQHLAELCLFWWHLICDQEQRESDRWNFVQSSLPSRNAW